MPVSINSLEQFSGHVLSNGKFGGQIIIGGTQSGDDLTLLSTSDSIKGSIIFDAVDSMIYDCINDRLSLGTSSNSMVLHGNTYGCKLHVDAEGSTDLAEICFGRHSSTAGLGAHLIFARSRGTHTSPTVVQSGDYVMRIDGAAFDGTDYELAAQIDIQIDGTPGNDDMPGRIVFLTTPDGAFAPTEKMRITNDGTIILGNLGSGNYTEIESDGTIEFKGTATVWEDLRVPVTSTKLGGTKDPGFSKFKDNGSGSQGVFVYHFDKSTEEELYFTVQMPHSWKEGSTIYPHVHWAPIDTDTGTVVWGLEYTWASIDGTFGNTTLLDFTADAGDGVAYKHQIIGSNDGIIATNKTLSSMLICRIYRNVASDTYNNDAALLEIDFHYEMDTIGSRAVLTK